MSTRTSRLRRWLDEAVDPVVQRILSAVLGITALNLGGAGIYYVIGRGDWPYFDCLYHTVVSLTTVGYGEMIDFSHHPAGRWFTMVLLVVGAGLLVYFVSLFVALFVEGHVATAWNKRRMQSRIDALNGHIIVCGPGAVGFRVMEELILSRWPLVLIDRDEERLAHCAAVGGERVATYAGECTEDDVLRAAGVERAHGLVAALSDDPDNDFLTLTARGLNPNIRIVSRAVQPESERKLRKAGADSVVAPALIGGMRIVSEMVRPHVVTFLDVMLRDKDRPMRIEELPLSAGSALAGRTLAQATLAERHLLVLAVRQPDGGYDYSPGADYRLAAGTTLIVLGPTDAVADLRARG